MNNLKEELVLRLEQGHHPELAEKED